MGVKAAIFHWLSYVVTRRHTERASQPQRLRAFVLTGSCDAPTFGSQPPEKHDIYYLRCRGKNSKNKQKLPFSLRKRWKLAQLNHRSDLHMNAPDFWNQPKLLTAHNNNVTLTKNCEVLSKTTFNGWNTDTRTRRCSWRRSEQIPKSAFQNSEQPLVSYRPLQS